MNRIAVIRISGKTGLNQDVIATFKLLRLYKKYTCIIIPSTPKFAGMIKKVKDFSTWGEIDEPTFKMLLEKRGRIVGNKPLTDLYVKEKTKLSLHEFASEFMQGKKELKEILGIKLFFRLSPPRGGFERKGTKKPYSIGGVLGYRKNDINKLLQRMI